MRGRLWRRQCCQGNPDPRKLAMASGNGGSWSHPPPQSAAAMVRAEPGSRACFYRGGPGAMAELGSRLWGRGMRATWQGAGRRWGGGRENTAPIGSPRQLMEVGWQRGEVGPAPFLLLAWLSLPLPPALGDRPAAPPVVRPISTSAAQPREGR